MYKRQIQEHDPEATYGGFYTQEQMKEIIDYARSRQVTVVPEIDVYKRQELIVRLISSKCWRPGSILLILLR